VFGNPQLRNRSIIMKRLVCFCVLAFLMASGAVQAQTTATKIVFHSNQNGNDDIWIMDENGENRQNVTNTFGSDEIQPSICADGLHIVFVSNKDHASGDIFIMDVDGSNPTNLLPTDLVERQPDCGRPLGVNAIVFRGRETGTDDAKAIFRMNLDGTGLTAITNPPGIDGHDYDPTWCGDQVVFLREFRPGEGGINIMGAFGEDPRQIVCFGDSQQDASCNRLGNRLSFTNTFLGNIDVYRMPICSEGPCCPGIDRLTTDPAIDREAKWSSGGLHLTFSSDRDGDFEVYTMDALDGDSEPINQLTINSGFYDSAPDWKEVRSPN
jgi:Tol biopolymer transport system component